MTDKITHFLYQICKCGLARLSHAFQLATHTPYDQNLFCLAQKLPYSTGIWYLYEHKFLLSTASIHIYTHCSSFLLTPTPCFDLSSAAYYPD